MCGLVGVMVGGNQWTLNQMELDTFNKLLYISAVRGKDSTGVMTWDGKDVRILKSTLAPSEFISSDTYSKFLESHKDKIKMIFGHTRLATVGSITAKNAHPFRVNNQIILMHNGSVNAVDGATVNEHEVDSMALAHALSSKTIEEVFESYSGAVATIWFDKEKKTLNLYRNSQRPLYITESRITNYLASEERILDIILNRNFSREKFVQVPENSLISFSLEDIQPSGTSKKIEKKWASYPQNVNGSWGYDEEFGYIPYQETKFPRQNNTAARGVLSESKSKPAEKPIIISNSAKDNKGIISIQGFGPFVVGKNIACFAYHKEHYATTKNEEKYKVICTPIFVESQEQYDTSEYNSAKLVVFNQTLESADNLLKDELLIANISNIRYNAGYKNKTDKLTVYLTNPQSVKIGDKINES